MTRPTNPRIQDVARRAGVATGTVSNVLNNPHKVAEATRVRVEQAIDELGFVRNNAARTLVSGRSDTVGMVVIDLGNSLFVDIARGAEAAAAAAGFHLLIANADVDRQKQEFYIGRFEEARVAGIILAPADGPLDALRAAQRRELPAILVNAPHSHPDLCCVMVDEELGGFLAAQHVLERGARRLVYLAAHPGLAAIARRRMGIERAVAAAGADLDIVRAEELSVVSGRESGREILRDSAADAIICPSDSLAIGVIQAAAALGRNVPGDVLVIGYDNNHFAAETRVPVSTVSQPGHEMGRIAMGLLLDELRDPDHAHRTVVTQPELIIRQSTTPLA